MNEELDWWDTLFNPNMTLCPKCNGEMLVRSVDEDTTEIVFECFNRHKWVLKEIGQNE